MYQIIASHRFDFSKNLYLYLILTMNSGSVSLLPCLLISCNMRPLIPLFW